MAGKKGRSGRKPIEINYDELRKVCALHPTDEELAAFLECSVDTITNLKKNNPEFMAAYEGGKGSGKLSLRRRQWSSALGEVRRGGGGNAIEVIIQPNVTMQIWLGKQILRQSDAPDTTALDMLQEPVSAYAGIPWEMISPSFLEYIQAVRMHKYVHYWTKGGRGSTKSSAISLAIVDGIIRFPNTHGVVMREVFATIKDSAYAQIEWAADELGQADNFIFKKSPLEITYKPTGQKILFRGLDNPQKLRSIKVKFGYIAWAWYEEASDIRGGMETIRNVNQSLMRSGDKFWAFYSYNPPKSKNNWVNVAADAMQGRSDTLVHSSDLLSVPPEWLGEQFLIEAEALKEANPNAYEHEYLGIATGSGGDVFDNVVVEPISKETISGLQMVRRGIDFGFATDPFAFVQCGYNRLYDTLYIFDEFEKLKIHDDEAAEVIRGKGVSKEPIYADSADPKGISNMQREGLNVLGCTKFPGSREHGYKFLQRWKKIVIDPTRCPNAKREFVGCEYERDKDGNFLSVIPKANDHTIDGVRYALDAEMRNARAATWGNASARA